MGLLDAPGAPLAQINDLPRLRLLEGKGQAELVETIAAHKTAYDDSTLFQEEWTNTTAWSTASQSASNGALFWSSGVVAGSVHAFPVADSARFRIVSSLQVGAAFSTTAQGTPFAFVGVNKSAAGVANPSGASTIGIGVDPVTHYPMFWQGSSVGGSGQVNLATAALAAGLYLVTIVGDEVSLSFSLTNAAGSVEFRRTVLRSVITGITNLALWLVDTQGALGIGIGRIGARASSATLFPRISPNASPTTYPFSEAWASRANWSAGSQQVSAGKLFYDSSASGGTTPGTARAFNTLNFSSVSIASTVTAVSGTASSGLVLVGLAAGSTASAPAAANLITIGINPTDGKVSRYHGTNVGGPGTVVASSNAAQTGNYTVTVTADDTSVVLTVTYPDGTTTYSYTVARSSIPVPLTQFVLWQNDSRQLSGDSIGIVTTQLVVPAAAGAYEGGGTTVIYTQPVITAVSTSKIRVALPATYDSRMPSPLVMYFHGHGRTAASAYDDSQLTAFYNALNAAGYIVASADAQGDAWGKPAAVADYEYAYRYVRDHYAVSSVILAGQSMGGTASLTMLAQRNIPNIRGWYFQAPVVDLRAMYDANYAGTFKAEIQSSYGIASDGSDFATKTLGYNPALQPGYAFRSVPMRLVLMADDTVVPSVAHGTPLLAKVAPYAVEASSLNLATGGHIPNAAFVPSDALAFFSRCLRS